MKLSYRGASYQAKSRKIETVESGMSGQFRGQTYPIRRSQSISKSSLGVRKYRGIPYEN
ncbi:DUF4278 domain-containing protein [Lusitaniella coriacea]|uniref:DUF4278 domain-containing protein n=1 Tax=Lusitaniella coriacea TaxID=1983105 RepID=UPI003CF78AA0